MDIKKHLPSKKPAKTKHLQVRLTEEDFLRLGAALRQAQISFQDFLEASCKAFTEESWKSKQSS